WGLNRSTTSTRSLPARICRSSSLERFVCGATPSKRVGSLLLRVLKLLTRCYFARWLSFLRSFGPSCWAFARRARATDVELQTERFHYAHRRIETWIAVAR